MSDIDISKKAKIKPITEIAEQSGIGKEFLELYGKYKAKVGLNIFKKMKDKKNGKLILVSAITPTPAGEGKTTVSIGISMALNKIGVKSAVALREPSMGPLFGIKGGATG